MRAALAATAAAGLAAGFLTLGGGTASADPVTLSQQYTCKFPIISNDPIKIVVNMDLPKTMKVGETVPEFPVNVTSTVSKRAAQGMGVLGGVTLEGKATSSVSVSLPQGGTLPIQIKPDVPKTNIPDPAADFDIKDIKAASPGGLLTWEQKGQAKFDVTGLKLHNMIVRDASGAPVEMLNDFEAPCTLDAGQPTTIGTMEITDDGSPVDPVTPTDPTTPTDPADPADPSTGNQDLNAKVKPGGTNPGTLSMTQAGNAVALSEVEEGKGGLSSGALNAVTVKDDRNGNKGWSLTGKVTDFTGSAGTIPGDNLSWKPSCDTAPGSASTCAPGTEGKVGATGATLASAADAEKTGGTFTVGAGLNLDVPATAKAGDYKSVLTLTLA
ncbi:DUF6801 domain-containing protein [Streptomyces boninensis]|uniref:DUF6801 domain-containing protein n=1 Tax=Streptomyces boninensis TaxID=2039455 RepID=UPI003B20F97D